MEVEVLGGGVELGNLFWAHDDTSLVQCNIIVCFRYVLFAIYISKLKTEYFLNMIIIN